jgi:KDO2-lipid IV(A) lauroyltransferase
VRKAFIAHARYYAEILRAPYYDPAQIDRIVSVRDWDHWHSVLAGGVVVALPHFGNFEPYGIFVVRHGLKAMGPIEEIEPRELYEFLRDRRGSGQVRTVPLGRALRPMLEALRRREVVALVADRDLAGDGVPVTFFGLPTTMPSGPAVLALRTGSPLIVGACRRVGTDRFTARGWHVADQPHEAAADAEALTQEVARRFEEAIAEAPEQWWGAFQPIWSDQRAASGKS